jgi:hypothetical protein
MSTLKYAALYEDIAHQEFLRCLLPQLAHQVKGDITIEEVPHFRVKATNKSEVDKFCTSASKVAFVEYGADFFVVCRDIDSIDSKVYTKKHEELTTKLHHTGTNKTILCLPVQCIEHWLLHLKQHREKPNMTKNEPVENLPRNAAKVSIYGKVAPKREYCSTVVNDHCTVVHIDWIASRSASFREFAANVHTVVQYLSDKTEV